METLNYGRLTRYVKSINPILLVVFCLAVLSLIVLILSAAANKSAISQTPIPTGMTIDSPSASSIDCNKIFEERIEPVLEQLRKKNDNACDQAIAIIHSHFDTARSGAPVFADSIIGPLNSIKTTWLAGKGLFERWWYNDPRIQPVVDHVRWNYEQHVTSGPRIRDAILSATEQLETDFQANRNEAIQAIGSSLKAANFPVRIKINQVQLDDDCQEEVERAITDINGHQVAEHAAAGSAAAFGLSTAASIVAEQAIVYVVGDSAIAAGGGAAAGVSGGSAAGSFLPGPGTILGAAGGLLAALAVDAWISHENKSATIAKVDKSLTQIESAIIEGAGHTIGADRLFHEASERQLTLLHTELREALQEASQ